MWTLSCQQNVQVSLKALCQRYYFCNILKSNGKIPLHFVEGALEMLTSGCLHLYIIEAPLYCDTFTKALLVSISFGAGKYVVFFFYPLDFTFVCPTEIIAFSDAAEDFRKIGCEVIAASVDSHFSHFAW